MHPRPARAGGRRHRRRPGRLHHGPGADPALYEALANRAIIAQEQGRADDAIEDLTRALELVGPDASLLYNRGYVNRSAERWQGAIDDGTPEPA
ncbi:hypothetical protein E6P78_26185 [Streptomyces sp. A0958]|uniref:tetratricopeptide repeat protein n=1 Tax=Streptomyces sp. A0958 TaxID=2563101 RepID=UPI00109ECAB7|nr:tetratricopeptide repeat protein [Streptomyces sp. A0958]THA60765.1 hypothetical protein E6P78_26185 [Streptomyces sp. A0958]